MFFCGLTFIMVENRMCFFPVESLLPNQREAEKKLPIEKVGILWSPEERELLSPEQMFIASAKLNGATYNTIREYFSLSCDKSITAALTRTALGYYWVPKKSGGSLAFLSPVYIRRLRLMVQERCLGLNCLRTVEVLDFIVSSRLSMYHDAQKRLLDWGCEKLAIRLTMPEIEFTDSYLTHFCKNIGLFIKKPEVIEQLRRQFCNQPIITQFFSKFSVLMANIEPFFIYNADETGLSTKRAYRIITSDPRMHAAPAPSKDQHITAMCCFSPSGVKMDLFFIFSGIQSIPFPVYPGIPYYAVSKSGWMTEHLFNIWCILFVSHVQY